VLRHLPLPARVERCARLAGELQRFNDTFTASQAGLYETHKVLLLERLVDALADHLTLDGDALRALLDDEELALRRRIHADWSAACGP
jgi:2-hydroxychromene-2-carboxylate isomerase